MSQITELAETKNVETLDFSNPFDCLKFLRDKINYATFDLLVDDIISDNTYNERSDSIEEVCATIEQALAQGEKDRGAAEELEGLHDENDKLLFELFLAEKQYKELTDITLRQQTALKIVVKKCVNMFNLNVSSTLVEYNRKVEFEEYRLTEEEFNLLKEMSNSVKDKR